MNNLLASILRGDYDDSSSDDEQAIVFSTMSPEFHRIEEQTNRPSRSRVFIDRDRVDGNKCLVADYFAEKPVFPPNIFRRRFRMNHPLFNHILEGIQHYDDYFIQKNDAAGVPGLSGLQKMTAAVRVLTYGMPADAAYEYIRICESTTIEALQRFCRAIVGVYEEEYLRSPNEADISRLLREGEIRRGLPGMLDSLDCMHWPWRNCPTAWYGQFTCHINKPTIILEAVASYDLWIWLAFFGMPGSHNDINVLDRSPLFAELAEGRASPANYTINGHQYTMGYYLIDGIYPPWATLVQAIREPITSKKKRFTMMQEAYRKDVERAFGVLQARFAIVRGTSRSWFQEDLGFIMKTCIILHNMIIEDERDDDPKEGYDITPNVSRNSTPLFTEFIARHQTIRSSAAHHTLRNDIIDHLWELYGEFDHESH